MKNKKSIYILLPLVLLIWGAVLYQFFSFSKTDELSQNNWENIIIKPIITKKQDTSTINVNYRDPFLGKMYSLNTPKIVQKKTSKVIKPIIKVAEIIWPKIVYKGIVSDVKDKKRVYMLIIDGKTALMRKGEIQNEVLLKDGNRESIYVKYKEKVNLILLQE